MSKKELQKRIRQNGCYILSDGTHRYEDLLSKAYDLMVYYNLRTNLKNEILEVFGYKKNEKPRNLQTEVYYGKEIPENKQEDAAYIWNESIYHYLNDVAPAGYYFGTTEGDGSCFGFFKVPEDEWY